MAGQQGTSGVERPRKLGRGLASLLGAPVKIEDVAQATPVANATTGGAPGLTEDGQTGARRGHSRGLSEDGETGARREREESAGGAAHASVELIALDQIVPSPFQPRQHFDEAGLAELSASIRTAGVMQPVLVRRVGGSERGDARTGPGPKRSLPDGPEESPGLRPGLVKTFELIAGERRWRAAGLAGLSAVPAIVVEVGDQAAAEWALIENVQRVDLGPVERARAMGALAERFGLTHEEIGERLGIDRASVSNHLRMLELSGEELALVERGTLTMGHAKAVLGLPGDGTERRELLLAAAREGWSVRRLEDETHRVMVKMMGETRAVLQGKAAELPGRSADELIAARARAAEIAGLEKRLMEHLGTKVRIITNGKGTKGRIVVEFYTVEGFEGVMGKMGVGD